jgi:GT2 family glycosyltransferase
MNAPVSILVLCHNNLAYTRQCLAALRRETDSALYELIVIDNASSDQTAQYLTSLESEMENLKIILSAENLGFGGGNNRAAEAAGGRFLVFLNNDTEVRPGWLEPLVAQLEGDLTVGAAGAKLIYPNGRLQEAGGIIFRDGHGWNFGRDEDPRDPLYNNVREVDYCSAAALMIRAALFRRLGGFDRQFNPAYWEDTDLCFGVRRAGYRVIYEPRSEVIHHEGVTAGKDTSSGFKRYQEINREKFIRKWAAELAHQPVSPARAAQMWVISDRRRRHQENLTPRPSQPLSAWPIGLTPGEGLSRAAPGWHWMGQQADFFVWAEALRRPAMIECEVRCRSADYYQRFPFELRAEAGGEIVGRVRFLAGDTTQPLFIALESSAIDRRIRLICEAVLSPGSDAFTVQLSRFRLWPG